MPEPLVHVRLTEHEAETLLVHALSFGVELEIEEDAVAWQTIADKVRAELKSMHPRRRRS